MKRRQRSGRGSERSISTIHIGINILDIITGYTVQLCVCVHVYTQGWRKVSHILYMTDLHAIVVNSFVFQTTPPSHCTVGYTVQLCVCVHVYTHNISKPIFPPYILVPMLDITTGYTVQVCVCVHVYTHNISEPIPYSGKFSQVQIFAKIPFLLQKKFSRF